MKIMKQDLLTVPNILSYFRILLIPIFAYIYLNATTNFDHILSIVILVVSGLTDLLDGKIARKYNQITELGKLLDPFADKLTLVVVAFCMSLRMPQLLPMLIVMILKEAFMVIVGFIVLQHNGQKLDGAMLIGKICTFALYGLLFLALIIPNPSSSMLSTINAVGCILMVITILYYANEFRKMWNQK